MARLLELIQGIEALDNPQMNSAQTSTETWKCATCGISHVGVPMSFAAEFPDMYANMKREERDTRALMGSDQCVIDQQWFFLRGCLEVPILGSEEPFVWGLWASVKEEVYDRAALRLRAGVEDRLESARVWIVRKHKCT
jgi:hypothetical protein